MAAVHLITAVAQKETAKQAILKQLRKSGAASAQMPGSVHGDSDEDKAALAALIESGAVRAARPVSYYLDEARANEPQPANGFVALLAILIVIVISLTASLVALAVTAG